MRRIAFTNDKGAVGKTTTITNLILLIYPTAFGYGTLGATSNKSIWKVHLKAVFES